MSGKSHNSTICTNHEGKVTCGNNVTGVFSLPTFYLAPKEKLYFEEQINSLFRTHWWKHGGGRGGLRLVFKSSCFENIISKFQKPRLQKNYRKILVFVGFKLFSVTEFEDSVDNRIFRI